MIILYRSFPSYCLGQAYHNLIRRKLKQIPVPGKDCRVHPLCLALLCQSSQNIICLISFFCHNINAHCRKDFLDQRHLFSQFLRHRLTRSLICLKHLVTESRRLQVKCHRQILGLLLLNRTKKNIQESIYCSCMFSL